MRKSLFRISIVVLTAIALNFSIYAQTTSISYQGTLEDEGSPANALYYMKFRIYNSGTFGTQLGNELIRTNVTVSNGMFSFNNLDFGVPFTNDNIWLEIDVRKGVIGSYTTLSPRQKVTSSPTAIRSLSTFNSDRLGNVPSNLYARTNDSRFTNSRSPTAGSSFYIQNSTSQQSSSNFRISGLGRANQLVANSNLSIGSTSFSNPLFVSGNGTDVGGVGGINNVVARFRNQQLNDETAISLDSAGGEDSIIYFSKDGDPRFQIRQQPSDSPDFGELQIRRQTGNSSEVIMRFKKFGNPNTVNYIGVRGLLEIEDGVIRIDQMANVTAAFQPLCTTVTGVIFNCNSSRRFKTNIQDYTLGLDLIKQLRPVSYNFKESDIPDMGLIAEDVAELEPLLATYDPKGRVQGVKYGRVAVVAVNAINEQQTQIESMQSQIDSQRTTIRNQSAKFEALKALVCINNKTAEICK